MYICNECKDVFSTPSRESAESFYGVGSLFNDSLSEVTYSPCCQANYTEAMTCKSCEETYISVEDFKPFCDTCFDRMVDSFEERIRKYHTEEEWESMDMLDLLNPKVFEDFREDEIDALLDYQDFLEPFRKEV